MRLRTCIISGLQIRYGILCSLGSRVVTVRKIFPNENKQLNERWQSGLHLRFVLDSSQRIFRVLRVREVSSPANNRLQEARIRTTPRPTDRQTDRQTDRPSNQATNQLIDRPTDTQPASSNPNLFSRHVFLIRVPAMATVVAGDG